MESLTIKLQEGNGVVMVENPHNKAYPTNNVASQVLINLSSICEVCGDYDPSEDGAPVTVFRCPDRVELYRVEAEEPAAITKVTVTPLNDDARGYLGKIAQQ